MERNSGATIATMKTIEVTNSYTAGPQVGPNFASESASSDSSIVTRPLSHPQPR